jgi:hypothetical protein
MGIGGGFPPEALKVTCISKEQHAVYFVGHETAPDTSKVSLLLVGQTDYFTVGRSYAVVFQPLPADTK